MTVEFVQVGECRFFCVCCFERLFPPYARATRRRGCGSPPPSSTVHTGDQHRVCSMKESVGIFSSLPMFIHVTRHPRRHRTGVHTCTCAVTCTTGSSHDTSSSACVPSVPQMHRSARLRRSDYFQARAPFTRKSCQRAALPPPPRLRSRSLRCLT